MTLYEEIYYNTPNLTKFYRYEGFGSRPYFQFQGNVQLTNILNYIYFSKTEKHHQYYVQKRLKQLISQQVLEGTDIELNKKALSTVVYLLKLKDALKIIHLKIP